jgi:hypothetical protein
LVWATSVLDPLALAEPQTEPFVCPVTEVNGGKGGVYGNEALEVVLWPRGRFTFGPGSGFVDAEGGMGVKVGWDRKKEKGHLEVGGRRLDGQSPPAYAYIYDYGDTGFQPIYLVFPTPGCWEIVGSVADASLKYVVLVETSGGGPTWRFELERGWRVSHGSSAR